MAHTGAQQTLCRSLVHPVPWLVTPPQRQLCLGIPENSVPKLCQPWAHTAHRAPVSAASCLLSHAETKKWDLAVRLWAENCKYFHKHPCISLIYFILTYTHMYIYKHIYILKPEKVWRKWRYVCPVQLCRAQGKPRDGARLQLSILPMSQTAAAWAQSWDCSTPWGGLALHHPSTEQMPAADVLHSLGSANSTGCFLSLYLA